MSEFYFDMRDVRFNLYDVLNVEEMLKHPPYQDFDVELFDSILVAAEEQAREVR